jgi:CheY-like chemotaxis protein
VHNLPVILVVEDDRLVQTVVEDSLTEGGFEIVLASSGENAVELLDTSQGKYRALVTDINLGRGGIDGWDVAKHAREIDPNVPVIYMSGKDASEWASKGVTVSCWRSRSRQRNSSPPFLSSLTLARRPKRRLSLPLFRVRVRCRNHNSNSFWRRAPMASGAFPAPPGAGNPSPPRNTRQASPHTAAHSRQARIVAADSAWITPPWPAPPPPRSPPAPSPNARYPHRYDAATG